MFSDVKLSFGPFQVQRRQRWRPQSVFYHFSDFYAEKAVSFPFKWSPERSHSTSSFTCRSLCKFTHCSSTRKDEKRRAAKTVIGGSRVVPTAEECSGFDRVGSLWERAAKWASAQPYGAVMGHSAAAAPAFPARFYTVHISCKWAFTGPVINLQ